MKKAFIKLLPLFMLSVFFTKNISADSPALLLNPQDVPIFYNNHPLSEMNCFTVIFSLPVKDAKKIENLIKKGLETLGEVIHLKDNDIRGFGTGNVLLLQMGPVKEWNGKETPLSRISLSVETSVTLDKTSKKTFPMVWSINTFFQQNFDSNFEMATQKLLADFIQNYQYANQNQVTKPIFYIYN